MDTVKMAKDIIFSNRFLTLSTSDRNGSVWSTPLSYSVDSECNFYFTTAVDSIHINNIRDNPYVAFSIFDSTRKVSDVDGLQVKGVVGEVERDKLKEVVESFYRFVFPDPEERIENEAKPECFLQDEYPVYRFFQIYPTEIYKRDTENTDVDRRVQIDLDELRALM
jgi:uncharacterized protein YhbP (UPF0306 family)